MALETLDVQTAERATGTKRDLQSVSGDGGFRFLNDGNTVLYIANDAAAITLAVKIEVTIDGVAVTDTKDIVVADGEVWVAGPFPPHYYNDADGYVFVTPSTDLVAAAAEGVVPVKLA